MRILYFHQHFTTPQGTGGTRSYEFARALIARGHEVTLVCGANNRSALGLPVVSRHGGRRGRVDGIEVIELPLPYSNYDGLGKRLVTFLRFVWGGTRIALREDYDLVFATSTPLTAGVPGIVARLCRRKKFIFEVRDLWPELPRALGMKNPLLLGGMSLLEWVSYRMADGAIGLSPGIVEGIARRSRRGQPIVMIPNGCDLGFFTPGRREELTLPGTTPGDFVAVFAGAHGRANGLGAVLDAAAVLQRRRRTDIKLVLIGDGREKPALARRAQEDRLDNCLFLPPMKKRELALVLGRVDAGLMILANVPAFYRGTSPNKFFDYISAGLPVVNNYPGWLAEMITARRCGTTVEPGDAEAFADALCKLADHPPERAVMAANARRLAESEFSRATLSETFVNFLESMMTAART